MQDYSDLKYKKAISDVLTFPTAFNLKASAYFSKAVIPAG